MSSNKKNVEKSDKNIAKRIIIYIIFLILVITVVLIINNQNKAVSEPLPLIKVRYGSVPAIVVAPAHVAYDKGFFAEEGLDLTIEINPDGKTSLDRLLNGDVDIASTMATPVVYSSFNRDDFYIIAKVGFSSKIHWAVGRKDSGINSIEDIKGKRIAVMYGTSGQFYMDSWLLYHGLFPKDLDIVNMNGPDSVEAIKRGDVDAMFCWFPFPVLAEWELGDNAFVFPSDKLVPGSWVVIVKKDYAHNNPDILNKFLKAMVKSENFIKEYPDEAMSSHSVISGVDKKILVSIFDNMKYNISLDQLLILDLEAQARWIISYGYVDSKIVPNYLDIIYPNALKLIKPQDVTIIPR